MGLGGLPAVEENINFNRVCAAKSNAAAAADIPSVIPPSPSPPRIVVKRLFVVARRSYTRISTVLFVE